MIFSHSKHIPRIVSRLIATSHYLFNLVIWSKLFIVSRTTMNMRVDESSLRKMSVNYPQPQLNIHDNDALNYLSHGFSIVNGILFANLQSANLSVPRRHALPGPAFAGVYLWDSAFIALIWQYWDNEVALDILESVLVVRDGDRLQHVKADFTRSKFTQPPLLAWALCKTLNGKKCDRARLEENYETLVRYHTWLQLNRRLDNGLYFWQHPYESGVENSPRFSNTDEKKLQDTRHYAAPDFSAYLVLQCESLAELAERLGKRDDADAFREEAESLRKLMNTWLWNEEAGLYFDYDVVSGTHVASRTVASLIPLAAGVPDTERAEKLNALICDPHGFGTLIPIPSVAVDDHEFEKDMWRGPVWINTAYLVLEGLKRYGFFLSYAELSWRLINGVFKVLDSENQVYEFYDPEHFHTHALRRKRGNLWKAFTLGKGPQRDFVGWSGLVNSLVIEVLFGLKFQENSLLVQPCLPLDAGETRFQLTLPERGLDIEIQKGNHDIISGKVTTGSAEKTFTVVTGESIVLEL